MDFYHAVMGWTFEQWADGDGLPYYVATTVGGEPVAGIRPVEGPITGSTVYLATSDLPDLLQRVSCCRSTTGRHRAQTRPIGAGLPLTEIPTNRRGQVPDAWIAAAPADGQPDPPPLLRAAPRARCGTHPAALA